jgi:hypothetical protein
MMLNQFSVQRFAQWTRRASIPSPRSFAIAAFGIAALATACSPIPRLNEAAPRQVPKSTSSYANGACFYSDVSGTDRMASGRVLHWCGPEPKGRRCPRRTG